MNSSMWSIFLLRVALCTCFELRAGFYFELQLRAGVLLPALSNSCAFGIGLQAGVYNIFGVFVFIYSFIHLFNFFLEGGACGWEGELSTCVKSGFD